MEAIIVTRGLPSGYIANIEERLAQTEVALLQALAIIHGLDARHTPNQNHLGVPNAQADRPRELEFNEVRIARVEEWQRFPLETTEQQRDWMRNRLATSELPTDLDSVTRQQEANDLANESHKRQRNQETGSAKKRRKTTSERRNTSNLRPEHEPDLTAPAAWPPRRAPAPLIDNGWTANTSHVDSLNSSLRTAASNLQLRDTDAFPPASHSALGTPRIDDSDTAGAAQNTAAGKREETQPEQYTSKAKRLSTLHSRKYF
ncbi:hypothetical protein E4T52_04805 [Aureobasidium sp. EXF-3400]|nr:hypothetical protein E4T51_03944 [Aureobasidium sp. EXF-12344]KAI4780280.1 hypothetical protein E4T52_04805 [Aureobasidium sp. EXF-3400]